MQPQSRVAPGTTDHSAARRAATATMKNLKSWASAAAAEHQNERTNEFDDHISRITIEDYAKFRLRLIIKRSRQLTPPLVARLKYIKIITALLVSVGSLLVVFKLNLWVTFTVALAGAISNFAQHQNLATRIMAHNNLVSILHQLRTQLNGLSLVRRRSREVISQCVITTETCLLSTITARTGLPADLGAGGSSGETGESKESDSSPDRKVQKSNTQ